MLMRRALILALAISRIALAQQGAPEILIRLDDAGMNRSVNDAIARIAATGIPVSVSVLFVAPRHHEAVELLKRHPHIAVGVHLALNSEWKDARWGPVLGRSAVPSLVDSGGHLPSSREQFLASAYKLDEVEREISAQVERALGSGLRITYVDAHMGMLEATPALRAVLERVATRHGLAVSRRFGEAYFTLWNVPVADKEDTLRDRLANPKRDSVNLIVVHPAEQSAEMDALIDLNAPAQNAAHAGVGAHRQAELEAILAPEILARLRAGGLRLITYRDLADRNRR